MKTTENTKKTYVAPSIEVLGVVMCNLLSGSELNAYDKDGDDKIKGEESLSKHNTPWGNSGMWDDGK